jgi:hypothetical protein
MHLQWFLADHQAGDNAATERRAFMWTGVAQRVEIAADIEDTDAALFRFDDLDFARLQFTRATDNVASHALNPPAAVLGKSP